MNHTRHATLAGGCFWCTEEIFRNVKGVLSVIPGYTGGTSENPSYEQVVSGSTSHAEAIDITYDPSGISFEQLLDVFFHTHDPTQKNRQGNDIGSQYRSGIFYRDDMQKSVAEKMIQTLNAEEFHGRIVTQVVPFTHFYPAEKYHTDYYRNNPNQPYCAVVITPKLDAFRKRYAGRIK